MLLVVWNVSFYILEGTSFHEHVHVLVDFCILVVDLNLMEGMVSDSFAVDNETTLCNAANFWVVKFIIVVSILVSWEGWFILCNNFKWLDLSLGTDGYKSPVIETTFPELAKVELNLCLDIVNIFYVSFFNLVPAEQMVVVAFNW